MALLEDVKIIMLLALSLVRLGAAWRTFNAFRLVQFQTNAMNMTQFGSTRVRIDHKITQIDEKPRSSNVIVVNIDDVNITRVSEHMNNSSPILFLLPEKPVDTDKIENFLINKAHNVPVYFTRDLSGFPHGFERLMTIKTKPNALKRSTLLQNVVGIVNSSKSAKNERIALITVPYDTFSVAPTLHIGYNSSGIAISSFLECMRLMSKYPIVNNWVLIFAITDGRFCGSEGLSRLIKSFSESLKSKIEFAVSLDSIYTKTLHGHFHHKPKTNSSMYKFVRAFIESLKIVGIKFEPQSENPFTQEVFDGESIEYMSITGGRIATPITDNKPDHQRADSFAWALSEALLRTIYNSQHFATMIDQRLVDTSHWTRTIGNVPKMAPFRDKSITDVLWKWMAKFSSRSYVDEWVANQCFVPYTATDAVMLLYNPEPIQVYLALYGGALCYGVIIFMAIARQKIFNLSS